MNCSFCRFATEALTESEGNRLCELCYSTVSGGFLKIEGRITRNDGWSMLAVISLQNNLIIAMLKEKGIGRE